MLTEIFRVDVVNPVYGDSPYTIQVKFTFTCVLNHLRALTLKNQRF
jgi:hypothetical protein